MYMEEKIVTFKVKNDSLAPTDIFRLKNSLPRNVSESLPFFWG